MSDDKFLDESQDSKPEPTYEVGYGKPPVHTRFKPGEPRKKARQKEGPPFPETRINLVKRIRDEEVIVQGKKMTMLELALRQSFNATIKSGKTRDLKALFDLLDNYGAGIKNDEYENISPQEIALELMRAVEVAQRLEKP